jgi:hypothetical protein
MFNNLRELITSMPDEKACRDYLIEQRWHSKPICPYCFCDKVYVIENGRRFKCGHKDCYSKFSVTVGTIFEASNIALTKWLAAIYLCTAHKKGISSYQLGKDIGVSQKTAWFMLHRIREMMRSKEPVKLTNTVEVDEVYMGGKVKNMSKSKRTFLRENNLTLRTKITVMGMIEREGNLKLIALGKEPNMNVLEPTVFDNVDKSATLITDSAGIYCNMKKEYAAHEIVNHGEQEFVREGNWHTNSIEGAFSHFKRSIYGIYHQVTAKHLSRYCDETMFRYNLRKMKDPTRFTFSLTQMEGRLTYKHLIKKEEIQEKEKPYTVQIRDNFKRPVLALKNGEVVARYESINEAARQTGAKKQNIFRVISGKRQTHHGFEWKYE